MSAINPVEQTQPSATAKTRQGTREFIAVLSPFPPAASARQCCWHALSWPPRSHGLVRPVKPASHPAFARCHCSPPQLLLLHLPLPSSARLASRQPRQPHHRNTAGQRTRDPRSHLDHLAQQIQA